MLPSGLRRSFKSEVGLVLTGPGWQHMVRFDWTSRRALKGRNVKSRSGSLEKSLFEQCWRGDPNGKALGGKLNRHKVRVDHLSVCRSPLGLQGF